MITVYYIYRLIYMQIELVFYDEISNDVPEQHRTILRQRLYDLLEYQTISLKVTSTNNLESFIKNSNSEYVLVLALGTHLGGLGAIRELLDYAITEKTPLVAHILHQQNLFQLHPQCFLIKPAVYRKLGCPPIRPIKAEKRLLLMSPKRSKENFHDTYTPHWIAPSRDYEMKTVPGHFFGTYLLEELLKAGYTIKNIPESIRHKKRYCYPNENWEEIIQCLNDMDYLPKNHNVESFIEKLKTSYLEVYENGFYPVNTEDIFPVNYNNRPFNIKYNFFAGVCGGVKPAIITGDNNFQPGTQVVLFDSSTAAIEWQKYLIENWDGDFDTLETVLTSFTSKHPEYRSIIDPYARFTDKLAFRLDAAKIDKDELKKRWQRFLEHEISFMKLDLLDTSSLMPLLNNLNDPKTKAYIWFSNSFHMDWQMFYLGYKHMENKLKETFGFIRDNTSSRIAVENCTVLHSIR